MSLTPSTHDYGLKILRGIAKFAPKNADGTYQSQILMSPSAELALSIAPTDTKYISAESGLNEVLDKTVIEIGRTAKLKCNRLVAEIAALYFVADNTILAQASGSVTGEISGWAFPNRSVQLGGAVNNGAGIFGISAVSVSSYEGSNAANRANTTAYAVGAVYVPASPNTHWYMCTVAGTSAGAPPTFTTNGTTFADGAATFIDMGVIDYTVSTDYELDTVYGVVNILNTGAIAAAVSRVPASITALGQTFRLEVDYTRAAKSVTQMATKSSATIEGKFYFYSQNAKGNDDVYYAPIGSLTPGGDLTLKSANNYGAVDFTVEFVKPPTGSALYRNDVPS